MFNDIATWLADTSMSHGIQDVRWIIPTVQSIHILSVSVVISSVVLLDLRLLGVLAKSQTLPDMARRFLPWIWAGVAVLAATGLILIVGTPRRAPFNPIFQLKMVLLAAAAILTLIFQHNIARWATGPDRRNLMVVVGIVSLILWSCVLIAGRWIAYAGRFL